MDDDNGIMVIGAGVSGLATALRLAEAGHAVQVLAAEGSPLPGPGSRTDRGRGAERGRRPAPGAAHGAPGGGAP